MIPVIQKPKRLEYFLKTPLADLYDLCENHENYYYEKREVKTHKDGTPKLKGGIEQVRILYPSKGLLKVVQDRISKRILCEFDGLSPANISGAVKGRSHITNAKFHKGKKYHFVTDIRKFFPSITNDRIYKLYISLGFAADVSRILTRLTTYKGMLPQGTPTSPRLASMAFLPVDADLNSLCSEYGVTYSRYADDLTFSSAKNFKDITLTIMDIIKDHGFKPSHEKTHFKIGPVDVTGINVRNNALKPREVQVAKLLETERSAFSKEGLKRYFDSLAYA